MQTTTLFRNATTAHILIGEGTDNGGISVIFEMYEHPQVMTGTPTPEQQATIDSLNNTVFI